MDEFQELIRRTVDLGDLEVAATWSGTRPRWAPPSPQNGGGYVWGSDLWLYAAYAAGRSPAVASGDIVELNPRLDRDAQTAKLAAFSLWRILRESQRGQ